ncbi:MAG: hypothetical protein AB8G16_02505 [Gammaproteobacteria bacterium]
MPKSLPYRATTRSGEMLDVEFKLHEQTQSAVRVAQVLSAVLETVDREVTLTGDTGNGDLLQGMAMALAVRAHMIPMQKDQLADLVMTLVETALTSAASGSSHTTPVGHG